MSIYGATKGTELEETISASEQGEANGAVVYQALAVIAREQGYSEEAEIFSEIANMEAMHAGFYAVMNGKYPKDFFDLVKNMQQIEAKADSKLSSYVEKVRALNTPEALKAAEGMELIIAQENFHSDILKKLIERHEKGESKMQAVKSESWLDEKESDSKKTEEKNGSGTKVYVCKVCGYEYVGDLDDEPDDYVCPLCHKGKEYFVEKEY